MLALRRIQAALRRAASDEAGSAMTEFAIIAPLFILLIWWSQFFSDLGVLKLKAEEAARFAVWEMVAQRPAADVTKDVQARFVDLSSPASPTAKQSTKPIGVLAFPSLTIPTVTINDQIDAPFAGHINNPESGGGGGLLAKVLSYLNNFLNKTVDFVLKRYGFETKGEAQAVVTFQAPNTLFPGGGFLGYVFKEGAPPQVSMSATSPILLVNTWKAWPGKYALGDKNLGTDPYSTYGGSEGSAPELEVSKRMEKVAFFGYGSIFNPINKALQFAKLPGLTVTSTWKQKSGPVAMLQGSPSKHGWVPGNGTPIQRIGGITRNDLATYAKIDSPNPNQTDRARTTLPSPNIESVYWTGRGGMGGALKALPSNVKTTPYKKSYGCRDAWYMGATAGEVKRYGTTFDAYARQATPACP